MIRIRNSEDEPYECCQVCRHRGTDECQVCDEADRYEHDPEAEELLLNA